MNTNFNYLNNLSLPELIDLYRNYPDTFAQTFSPERVGLQTQPHINYYNILTKFGDIHSVVKELNSINIKNKHHMHYNNIILSDVYQIKAIDVNARKSKLLNLFGSHQYDNQIYSQLLSNHVLTLIHLGKTLGNILNMIHVNDFTNDIKLINLGINHVSKN
jgi:hypothetical protein